MADEILNGRDLRIRLGAGALSMTLNPNANTALRATGSWLSLDPATAELTEELDDGEVFLVPVNNAPGVDGSLLSFSLNATARDSRDSHLFVRLKIFQADSSKVLLTHDYRFDMPSGFNAWELADGVILRVAG